MSHYHQDLSIYLTEMLTYQIESRICFLFIQIYILQCLKSVMFKIRVKSVSRYNKKNNHFSSSDASFHAIKYTVYPDDANKKFKKLIKFQSLSREALRTNFECYYIYLLSNQIDAPIYCLKGICHIFFTAVFYDYDL